MERTAKQWHVEKARRLRVRAEMIVGSNLGLPRPVGRIRTQIMEALMETLSERQSRLLQLLGEQFGSDTQVTAARILSEYMMAMIDLPNIFERMELWSHTCNNSPELSALPMMAKWELDALAATLAHNGTTEFTVRRDAHKGVGVHATKAGQKPSLYSDSFDIRHPNT